MNSSTGPVINPNMQPSALAQFFRWTCIIISCLIILYILYIVIKGISEKYNKPQVQTLKAQPSMLDDFGLNDLSAPMAGAGLHYYNRY